MSNALLVHVADGGEHLAEGLGGIRLGDAMLGVGGEEVKEVTAAAWPQRQGRREGREGWLDR